MQVGWVKIALFNKLRSLWLRRITAENLCLSDMVVHIHDGVLAEEYEVLSSTLVVVENLIITLTVQLTLTRLVV